MAVHRGAYIRKLIEDSEMTITEVARRLSIGRNTLYRWMDDDQLQLTKMLEVAEMLNVDISTDFPKAEKIRLNKRSVAFGEVSIEPEEAIRTKYITLLEKHAELLEELSILKEEIAKYKTKKKN